MGVQLVVVGRHHHRARPVELGTVVAGRPVRRSLGTIGRGAGRQWTAPHASGRQSRLLLLRRHTGMAGRRLLLRRGGGWGLWPALERSAPVVPRLGRILGLLRSPVPRILSYVGRRHLRRRWARRIVARRTAIATGHHAVRRPTAVHSAARARRSSNAVAWITVGRHTTTAGHWRPATLVDVRRRPHVGRLSPVMLGSWPRACRHGGGGAAAAHGSCCCCSVTLAGTAGGPRGHRHRSFSGLSDGR